MLGRSMNMDKWARSELRGIPPGAPEQIKPAASARTLRPLVAPPSAQHPVPPPISLAAPSSPRQHQAMTREESREAEPAVRFATSMQSTKSADDALQRQVDESAEASALAAGKLSGPQTCQALLQGSLAPAAFGRAVSLMGLKGPPLLAWADEFGRCVTVLGSTILKLRAQIDHEVERSDKMTTRRVIGNASRRARAVGVANEELRRSALGAIEATRKALEQLVLQTVEQLRQTRAAGNSSPPRRPIPSFSLDRPSPKDEAVGEQSLLEARYALARLSPVRSHLLAKGVAGRPVPGAPHARGDAVSRDPLRRAARTAAVGRWARGESHRGERASVRGGSRSRGRLP